MAATPTFEEAAGDVFEALDLLIREYEVDIDDGEVQILKRARKYVKRMIDE